MSEELKKRSAFELFAQVKQTYVEAEEKAKQEAGSPRVERFRIGEDGEYTVRILPLAPVLDSDGNVLPLDRKGYEYPIRQLFLGIETASKKGGKKKVMNIPVIRTTDKGVDFSVDLIDTYVKIAKEMYGDDEDLIKLITSNSFSGGLKWNYQHAIMLLDLTSEKERAKGPQLWQCSHSLYKTIDEAKMRLWRDLREDGEQETCPISWFTDAYPVKVIRKNNNGKTDYDIEIGRKTANVKEEEVEKLLELPRIPEQIFRYTRYQMEATLVFLKQYDEKHDMKVCEEPDFKEAVEKLKGELPADDNSHFDISKDSKEAKEEITINSLWNEYDAIVDQDLGEKSDEYQELREKIRQFIEDNNLDVRISRSKNNQQILEEIEDALDEMDKAPVKQSKQVEEEEEEEQEEKPVKRAPKPKAKVEEPEEDEDEEEGDDSEPEEEEESEPTPVPTRTRRARPGSEAAAKEEEAEKEEADEEEEEKPEESPRRRLHARRMR